MALEHEHTLEETTRLLLLSLMVVFYQRELLFGFLVLFYERRSINACSLGRLNPTVFLHPLLL